MKKVIAILITLFVVNFSYSQVRLGLKAGGNLASLNGFNESKMKFGIHAGPVIRIDLAKLLFIQPELLYSLKGTQSATSRYGYNTKVDLNYLTLPVLVGFRDGQNFAIRLGPEIGRLLSGKTKDNGTTTDIKDDYKDFDFGADLGLSCSFKKMVLDLTYNYGFGNLSHIVFTDAFGNNMGEQDTGANRVIQFSLSYFFGKHPLSGR